MLFLCLHLFIPPSVPIFTSEDALIWLHDAQRMVSGDLLYKDIFEMTLPGTSVLYFAAFKLFGVRMWIPNVLLVFVGMALVWLTYRIGRSILLDRLALLPPLLFLTLIFRERLDPTHHWYCMLAILAAVVAVIEDRSPNRLIVVGVLCGLAATFTQSTGGLALLGFAIFLFWEHRTKAIPLRTLIKQESLLIASFATVILVVCSYFVIRAGLARVWFCTIVFNERYYGSLTGNNWRSYMMSLPEFLDWRYIPRLFGFFLVHALLPLGYVLVFLRYRQRSRLPQIDDECGDKVILLVLVGSASLLSVAAAPTWARLYYVSLPAVILFVWLLKSYGNIGQRVSSSLLVLTGILALAQPVAVQLHSRGYLDLPIGRAAFLNLDSYVCFRWVASQTQPGDYVFGGEFPGYYFPLGLRNPSSVPFVTPFEYTRPEQVREVIAGLEGHRVKLILWATALDLSEEHQGDHLGSLRQYIRERYHVAQSFPGFQVWSRKDGQF